jgi:hypothetical protein
MHRNNYRLRVRKQGHHGDRCQEVGNIALGFDINIMYDLKEMMFRTMNAINLKLDIVFMW